MHFIKLLLSAVFLSGRLWTPSLQGQCWLSRRERCPLKPDCRIVKAFGKQGPPFTTPLTPDYLSPVFSGIPSVSSECHRVLSSPRLPASTFPGKDKNHHQIQSQQQSRSNPALLTCILLFILWLLNKHFFTITRVSVPFCV
ncbi:hypothetical protein DPX16_5024 [Anabarilius grahami]|uniref:Secreted protein n=1 Tax=Anabarilius grahami TaxID=495550 RepID=A0A3N0Z975_ANAGA|nr:hypothetical protein DPX16_5024 [Anabarilius grahami]